MTALARTAQDTLRLTPGPLLDAEGVLALRPVLEAVVDAPEAARRVVLDLSRVDRMDGSGVGAIAFLSKRLRAAGLALRVEGARGQPLALLRELGLAALFGLEPRRANPLALLARPLPGLRWGARA